MDYRPQILDALKGSSSQEPMCIDRLQVLLGVGKATIQPYLDAMYNQVPASINRALITRGGIEKAYYWPTGVVLSFKGDLQGARKHMGGYSINTAKRPVLEKKPTNPMSQHQAQKGEQMKTDKKISNVDLVKHVAKHPGISNQKLLDALCGDDQDARKRTGVMICNCLSGNYLKRQEDKSLVLGDNVFWLSQNGITTNANPDSVAAAATESAAKTSSELGEPINVNYSLLQAAEVPSFLRKADAEPLAKLLERHSEVLDEAKPASKFRLAVTSDRTLTIYGKTAEPIELDANEALVLRDFIDGISMLFPAL